MKSWGILFCFNYYSNGGITYLRFLVLYFRVKRCCLSYSGPLLQRMFIFYFFVAKHRCPPITYGHVMYGHIICYILSTWSTSWGYHAICLSPGAPVTLRPRQNGRHFPDDILKWIFLNENVWISINISLKFVPRGPINNIPTLVQVTARRRPGDKPLSEPMMVRLPTHICVTRPQWVKWIILHPTMRK